MPAPASHLIVIAVSIFTAVSIRAETHTITFVNNCGYGYPVLYGEGDVLLSTGTNYTSNGPIIGAISYLQTGGCGQNGEGCTLIETTLINDGASGTDITLIPPHSFSVTSGFEYYNGCEGRGADCTYAECPTASHSPDENQLQVLCMTENVDLAITFCD